MLGTGPNSPGTAVSPILPYAPAHTLSASLCQELPPNLSACAFLRDEGWIGAKIVPMLMGFCVIHSCGDSALVSGFTILLPTNINIVAHFFCCSVCVYTTDLLHSNVFTHQSFA